MIAPSQIALAAFLTAVLVAVAGWLVRWPRGAVGLASAGAFVAIVAWRAIANGLGLNADFAPAVSIGDVGCLVAGALSPGLIARYGGARGSLLPALVGGLAGFVIDVLVL